MNRGFRPFTFGIVALGLIGTSGTAARGQSTSPSSLAFERLTSLVGEWKGVHSGTEVRLIYSLTADNTVLMEEFRPEKGPRMITMFSVDGDRLIATHYCSARNQPQMTTAPITEPRAKSVAFSLLRVTGMKSPDDWHNTGLVVTMHDDDHFTQEWTYQDKGATGKNVFHYTRTR